MKHSGLLLLIFAATALNSVRAETESIDLKALAKKARPAVMLLVASDAAGKEIATGTGFLVSSEGKLITNHHVIEGAASMIAKAENGGLFPVEGVLADDPKNDLVLLKIKAKDLPFLTLGNSDKIEVGTRIAVIGSPLGLEGTLSEGIVSAVRELIGDMKVLQVTAAISPGSSGSPVMNTKGDVVGIASALMHGGQALNFAVPVEFGVRLIAKIKPSSIPQSLANSVNTSGDDAIASDPNLRMIKSAQLSEDWLEMFTHAKVLVARYPKNVLAYAYLGFAYDRLNFITDSLAAYRQAIAIKPDMPSLWYNLGLAYGKLENYGEAIAAYSQAIKFKPDYAEAWSFLGNTYVSVGRTADGIEAYQQAIKFKPNLAESWYGLGYIYVILGRNDEALAACQQGAKINPNDALAWNALGIAHKWSGRYDEAITAFQQAIKIRPNLALAWRGLGDCYKQVGRSEDADAAFQRAKSLKPELFK